MLIMLVNEKLTHIKIHVFYYGMAYKVNTVPAKLCQNLTTTLKAFPCPYLIYPRNVCMNHRLILRQSKKLAPDHKGAHECKGAAYEYKIAHPDRSPQSPAFGLYSLNLGPNPLLCMVHFPQAPSQPTKNFHLTHVK